MTTGTRERHLCDRRPLLVRPASTAEDKAVAVGVLDRHAPVVPIRVSRLDLPSPGLARLSHERLRDRTVEVEDEQILLCRIRTHLLVFDEFEVPTGLPPTHHQQRMLAVAGRHRPPEDVQAEALSPKALGDSKIAARSRYPDVSSRRDGEARVVIEGHIAAYRREGAR